MCYNQHHLNRKYNILINHSNTQHNKWNTLDNNNNNNTFINNNYYSNNRWFNQPL